MATKRIRLARARKAAGYTQEQLAELLHIDRSTIVRWEAGQTEPLPYKRPKLARLLHLTMDGLEALLVEEQPRPQNDEAAQSGDAWQAVPFDSMKRRTLVTWGAAATAAAGLGMGRGGKVGASDVARLQRTTVRLHSLDQQHGGETLWQSASARVNDGYAMLEHGSYTEAIGRQIVMAVGRLQICAGWLAFDAGLHNVARACYSDALVLAKQSNDAEVETRAFANLAFQSNMLGRPKEALRFASAAEDAAHAPGGPPRLAAVPQLRRAISSALSGDATDADRAITDARKVLDREGDRPTEQWCTFLTPAEVDSIEAVCATALNRAPRAEQLLERSIASYDRKFMRNVALNRVRLAQVRLDARAVDGAAKAVHTALDDLMGEVASWRVNNELATVMHRLAKYPEVSGVDSALNRYAAINS